MNTKNVETSRTAEAESPADFASAFPGRVVASSIAISGFTIAIVAGLAAGNDPSAVLLRAIVATVACYFAGILISAVAAHVVHEHLDGAHAARSSSEAEASDRPIAVLPMDGARNVEKKAA